MRIQSTTHGYIVQTYLFIWVYGNIVQTYLFEVALCCLHVGRQIAIRQSGADWSPHLYRLCLLTLLLLQTTSVTVK